MKKTLLIFILTLSLWFVLAGRVTIQVFLLGIIICSILSIVLSNNISRTVRTHNKITDYFIKLYYIFMIIVALFYNLFVSAFRVSRLTFKINPLLSPRVATINTSLKHGDSHAMLVNFITLTQGTLIVDFDNSNRTYFIHWIDVHSDDEAELKKALITKHENVIAKLFY